MFSCVNSLDTSSLELGLTVCSFLFGFKATFLEKDIAFPLFYFFQKPSHNFWLIVFQGKLISPLNENEFASIQP